MEKRLIYRMIVMIIILVCPSVAMSSGSSEVGTPTPNNVPSQCGPSPSNTELLRTGAGGPYTINKKSVSAWKAIGFGGGTIHYPINAHCKRLGAIAVVPGFVSYENSIYWWGPRLASWGFVVITINTNTIFDQPNSRAKQLSAALDHVISDSTVGKMIDSSRLAAIGWSMGGGGALKLSTDRPLKAIIPQAPWYSGSYGSSSERTTPALFISCQADIIAPVFQHANPFYKDHRGPKMKIEILAATHYCGNSNTPNKDILGKAGIAWMKRYVDGDTRFSKFLCAKENYGTSWSVSDYDYANCS